MWLALLLLLIVAAKEASSARDDSERTPKPEYNEPRAEKYESCLAAIDDARESKDPNRDDSDFFLLYCRTDCHRVDVGQEIDQDNSHQTYTVHMYVSRRQRIDYKAKCHHKYNGIVRQFTGIVECSFSGREYDPVTTFIRVFENIVFCFPKLPECEPFWSNSSGTPTGTNDGMVPFALGTARSLDSPNCKIRPDSINNITGYYNTAPPELLPEGPAKFPTVQGLPLEYTRSDQYTSCLQEPIIDTVWVKHSYSPHWANVTAGVVEEAGKNYSTAVEKETLQITPHLIQRISFPGQGDELFESYRRLCQENDGFSFLTFSGVLDCVGIIQGKPLGGANFGNKYTYDLNNWARCFAPSVECQTYSLVQWFTDAQMSSRIMCNVRWSTVNSDNFKKVGPLVDSVTLLAVLSLLSLVLVVLFRRPMKQCQYQPITTTENDEAP